MQCWILQIKYNHLKFIEYVNRKIPLCYISSFDFVKCETTQRTTSVERKKKTKQTGKLCVLGAVFGVGLVGVWNRVVHYSIHLKLPLFREMRFFFVILFRLICNASCRLSCCSKFSHLDACPLRLYSISVLHNLIIKQISIRGWIKHSVNRMISRKTSSVK